MEWQFMSARMNICKAAERVLDVSLMAKMFQKDPKLGEFALSFEGERQQECNLWSVGGIMGNPVIVKGMSELTRGGLIEVWK